MDEECFLVDTASSMESSGIDSVDVMELECIERGETQYVYGETRYGDLPILAVCTPTSRGWKCRSIYKDILNHDYVSHESVETLLVWMRHDLKKSVQMTDVR